MAAAGKGGFGGLAAPDAGVSGIGQSILGGLTPDALDQERFKRALVQEQTATQSQAMIDMLNKQLGANPQLAGDPQYIQKYNQLYKGLGLHNAPMSASLPGQPAQH